MLSGFLMQHAKGWPIVERAIAGDVVKARTAFDHLLEQSASRSRNLGFGGGGVAGLASIDTNVFGFVQLASLYSSTFVDGAQCTGKAVGQVLRLYDTCSLVPDKRGVANLIIVEWAHGAETRTSYEEIRELLDKGYENAIRPWQYWLFFVGFSMNIAMFVLTYVSRERRPDTPVSNKTDAGDGK